MLLRNSISNTKKFFRKTLQSFKSLFSGDYQRLPKSPPQNPFSYAAGSDMNVQPSHKELDKFYSDLTNKWDSDRDNAKKEGDKNSLSSPTKQEKEVYSRSFMEFQQAYLSKKNHIERKEEYHSHNEMKSLPHERKIREDSCSDCMQDGKINFLVIQKLKELEMLDMSNVDHLLDIEEVLHYYSRLTCPAYLDIVDKFFMDMYAEFFGAGTFTAARSISSRLGPRSVSS